MERVLVFLDFANIDAGCRPFGRMDYASLLEYLAQGRFLVEAYAYVPVDPRRPEGRDPLIRHLQRSGWMVFPKLGKIAGNSYKSNVDVEMTIDMMRSAEQIRPDIMLLCSGDGDFIPVVRELRRRGIRTEVASFEAQADATLPYEASGFISLDVWQRELAAGATAPEDAFPGPEGEHVLPDGEDAPGLPGSPLLPAPGGSADPAHAVPLPGGCALPPRPLQPC